jgi:microcystin degradation protein MlrC
LRIAAGGFQHETNTFAPVLAGLADFEAPDAWPGLIRGAEIAPAVTGVNVPIAGFLQAAEAAGHEILPLLWCSATPSAPVTRDAYEGIAREMLGLIATAGPIDALYLDLHGAMVAEHLNDGEGELLARIRRLVGSELPIVASLDFHANVSDRMLGEATALVSYRTYPHIDMAETGARALALLETCTTTPPAKAMRRLPYLVPLHWQSTLAEPMAGLMRSVAEIEARPGLVSLSLPIGFPLADIPDCGISVLAYAEDAATAEAAAEALYGQALAAEDGFAGTLYTPDEAVRRAQDLPGTVIIADTQDNPGAGGTADTVGMLRALIAAEAEGAVLAVLCDPAAAEAAHRAGLGATLDLALGAGSGSAEEQPVHARFTVEALGDGKFTATGPFYLGSRMQLGPMALLKHGGVRVVVASRKQQAADQAMLRHLGVEPAEQKILVLKSSVHFRADFGPLAAEILIAAAPGANIADPQALSYKHLPAGLRISPKGRAYHPPGL